jgi:hypothetical protein
MGWRANLGVALHITLCACTGSCNEPRTKPAHTSSAHAPSLPRDAVVLAADRKARVVIVAPGRLFEDVVAAVEAEANPAGKKAKKPPKKKRPKLTPAQKLAQADTQRLAASVNDLSHYLQRMSGAKVEVARDRVSPAPGVIPILIAELAEQRFGPPNQRAPGKQGFRVLIQPSAIGLYGESDLATSYAIYELLDRLGCRWFMPGELGEEIPLSSQLALAQADDSVKPSTLYRGLWHVDEDFRRRNRLGGIRLAAGHMLEKWISPEQREQHPDWRAQVNGKPHPTRLRWSRPDVAEAIAEAINTQLVKKPVGSISISPLDGIDFDEGADRAVDAGDWDPTVNGVSLTDRLLLLANRVAAGVVPQHPDVMLGLLAYVSYSRPPVREQVHPNVVPVIAPITYCRPHPWANDQCPGAKAIRQIIEGWAARAGKLAFRGYGFNLAEPAAPHPMIRKWSSDLPYLFANKILFFQPETLPSFENGLPALYLGIRLSWNTAQEPENILRELFQRFYGHAAQPVRDYLDAMDRAWTETNEFSGAGLGYARRFTPELLASARSQLQAAAKACQTDVERKRVAMLEHSFSQLALYMKMERDFRTGELSHVARDLDAWLARAKSLAEEYAPNKAFGKTHAKRPGIYSGYVTRFLEPIYREAERVHQQQVLLASKPSCNLRYRLAPADKPPWSGPPVELATTDPVMDVCTSTWSSIGQHDYFGAMWYEVDVTVDKLAAGRRSFVWFSKVDGVAQAWVNGESVRLKDAAEGAAPTAETHLKSLTFEATRSLRPGKNRITILVQRTRLAELGAGGLLGPVYLYRDR